MGVVYEATDRDREGRVALKTFRPISRDAVLRLKDEFRVLHDVHHPNLVRLGELIEDRGQWFFTMELVDGVDFLQHVGIKSEVIDSWPDTDGQGPTIDSQDNLPMRVRARRMAPDSHLDEGRLRDALAQLVAGLDALHEVGKVHRDIKPSNVLVTHGSHRVVILDFGVVLDIARGHDATLSEIVGTAAYMAPEQAAASAVIGPAADWYSVGVLIYQSLTGQLPFVGHPMYVLTEKQRREPTPPHWLSQRAPADLSSLCMALLRPQPADRPSGKEILDELRVRRSAPSMRHAVPGQPFVGRDEELARLGTAFAETAAGRSVTAIVRGESGVGKTFLVKRFITSILEQNPEVVVLGGRCYERESVPYKAFDGVIDELTRWFARLERATLDQLLPERVAFAALMFPVLRSIDAIATAPRPDEAPDPQQQRMRLFAAVRELFAALSRRHRLIVLIDDVQWTDADSLALLRELLRPPKAPPILYIATLRPTEVAPVALAEIEKTAALSDRVHDLQLGALSDAAAEELVARLAGRPVPPGTLRSIADEARGHPLFIQELVHGMGDAGGAAVGPFHLDDAIVARVGRLAQGPQHVLALVTVAGQPLPQDTIARAARVEFDVFVADVEELRAGNLVRTSGARASDAIEPYHDRVREAVLASLGAERRTAIHEQLALALEAAQHPDPETLAVHWRGAGNSAQAVTYALRAAEQAAAAVAFGRAARLYRMVLDLGLATPEERRRVTVLLADALANGGQGTDAAAAYLEATHGASPADVRILEQRAAEQLLRTGHINDGLNHVRTLLASIGMYMPRSPRGALLSLLYQRAALRMRGLRYVERSEDEVAPEELERIDACWTVAMIGFVDNVRGGDFGTRHLRLALAAGERKRLVRALAVEAVYASNISRGGYQPRAHRLLTVAEQLADKLGSKYPIAFVAGATAVIEHVLGHYPLARSHAERSERIFRSSCTGVAWELDLVQMIALQCLANEGDLPELGRRLWPALADAEERGDLFGVSTLQILIKYRAHLFLDQPDDARRAATDAMARWTQDGFHVQHRHELLAHGEIDLYLGRGGEAHRRYDARWRAVKRSLVLESMQLRLELFDARGRAAIAAADEPGADRKALHRIAEHYASEIEKDRMGWADPLALLIRAGVAARRGYDDRAIALLRDALTGFQSQGMVLHAAITQRTLGDWLKGDEGKAMVATADAWLGAAQVKDIRRAAALLAPGFAPS